MLNKTRDREKKYTKTQLSGFAFTRGKKITKTARQFFTLLCLKEEEGEEKEKFFVVVVVVSTTETT